MSVAKLKEIVLDRIPGEIMLAYEALGIYTAIAEAADFLRPSSYRQLFSIIQHQAMGAFVLSLCKLFECYVKRVQRGCSDHQLRI